jgi:transposase-like protein
MTIDKGGLSALLLQRQLALARYETAWMMLHKFRRAMINVRREPLRGEVEVDDTWVGGTQAGLRGQSPTQRTESGVSPGCRREAGARTYGRYPNFRSETLLTFLKSNLAPGSTIYTDGLKSFTGLKEAGFQHVPRNQPRPIDLRKGVKSVVPLADRAIGNLQQWLLGTHHGVSRDQLQVYLDEFVFRHNRPKTPMAAFQTLLGPGTQHKPTKYEEIRGASDLGEPPAAG